MELKEFIADTLTQIVEGIEMAQKNIEESTAMINPPFTRSIDNITVVTADYQRMIENRLIENVEIEAQVEVVASSEKGGKAALNIPVLNIGGGIANGNKESSLNHIKFSVPVAFPVSPIKPWLGTIHDLYQHTM